MLKINVNNKCVLQQDHHYNTYMQSFLSECNIRPCCYDCQFKKLHRQADITLGDFWGVDNTCPDMYNPNGTSVVFVHSQLGKQLFDSIKAQIVCKPVTLDQAIKYNQSYLYSVVPNKNRAKFFKKLDKVKLDKLVKKYCQPNKQPKLLRLFKKVAKKMLKK